MRDTGEACPGEGNWHLNDTAIVQMATVTLYVTYKFDEHGVPTVTEYNGLDISSTGEIVTHNHSYPTNMWSTVT
jgi:hypothetical protein